MNELEFSYQLSLLPSAQHRAGLAGLVLMIKELPRTPEFLNYEGAVIEISKNEKGKEKLDDFGVTIRFNLEGLKALFDLSFKSFEETRWSESKIKNAKDSEIKEVERTDRKTGKLKLVKLYSYKAIVPHGAFLSAWDKSSEGLWVKLWRDMLWNIVRGVPTTRNPFNSRVDGTPYSKDVEELWLSLQHPEKATGQTGQYYLGAMAYTAENVPTKDWVRYQFLLIFWSFVAQVYRPAVLDKDGKRELNGYVLAIPDVANLHKFCRVFQQVLETRSRNSQRWGYLPREAIIDLPEEGALDLFLLLRDRLSSEIGDQQIRRTVLGVEVIHAEKIGNSGVKIRSISQVEPISKQIDRYAQIKNDYWCPWFRKQRLINLLQSQPESNEPDARLEELPAWYDFEGVLSRIPRKWLTDPLFSHDANNLFETEVGVKMETEVRQYAQIVYHVCQHYVFKKLETKFDMKWNDEKKSPVKSGQLISQEDFDEKKYKIANEAFLAVRSRTENQAFIDYFVSTLYPFIRKKEFPEFAEKLFTKTEEIRALTLLALSSQFPRRQAEEVKENSPSEAS